MKKLMLGLMMAFAVTAEAYDLEPPPIDGIKYGLNIGDGTATIVGFVVKPTEVDIAEVEERSGKKYIVTSVSLRAFYNCGSLKSVSLPNVTSIGEAAFGGCSSLTSVSLPKIETIVAGLFEGLGKLTSISLPNATTIGVWAFDGCSSLTSVSLPNVTSIGERVFEGCSSLTSVFLPNVTSIGSYAFAGCSELKKIYVNKTMKETLESDRFFYGIGQDCGIISLEVVVEPHPAEHTTVKVYTNGIEEEGVPFVVLSNATVDVVFTADYGYCFKDYTTVQTNTVTATDDPTSVDGPTVVKIPSLGEDEVRKAEWETETTITVVSTALKSGEKTLDKGEYEYACEFYGVEVKAEPTEADFKAVSKDAQVVQEDEIAVKKESIAAPSAGTVKVEDNKVQLGVTVLKTSDLTVETKDWGEVTLTADDVKVVDGKIVISVPVDSASGFMVIQTKDAAK